MNWTRAHDAHIAKHCEGLSVEGEKIVIRYPEDKDGWQSTSWYQLPHYSTDIAACIRAAEAWKAQRPNNRWWGVRHEGDCFAWACESSADARERVSVNSGHGEGESVAVALVTALYIATGGPA